MAYIGRLLTRPEVEDCAAAAVDGAALQLAAPSGCRRSIIGSISAAELTRHNAAPRRPTRQIAASAPRRTAVRERAAILFLPTTH